VSCDTCNCSVNPVTCTGTLRVFDNVTDCGGDGGTTNINYKGSYAANGVCNSVGNFNSIYYVPDPVPTASCNPAAPSAGSGTADLTLVKTICCP